MAIFRYEADAKNGKTIQGSMDAASLQEVEERLLAGGFRNIQVRAPQTVDRRTLSPSSAAAFYYNKNAFAFVMPAPQDQALFYRQMASLIHSGFNISTALADLGNRSTQVDIKRAARQLAAATASGATLSQEMGKFPTVFPAHVVGLVAAGESGGFLEFAFEEAALNAEQDAAVTQGMWWPRLLWWQGVWSVLLFAPVFPSLNLENIPKSVSDYIRNFLMFCLPIGVALHLFAESIKRLRSQPFARDFFDRAALMVPVIAQLAHRRALAIFTRVLRRLLLAGVSVPVAYAGAVEAVPNAVLRERLRAGVPLLLGGQGIDEAILATGMFGGDPVQLLVTGQKTGQFVEMLDRVTAYYQEEAARAIEGAKSAQRRAAVLLTIITSGYVAITATHGLMTLGFKLTEGWAE